MYEQEWRQEVVRPELGEIGGVDWGDWLHPLFTTQGAVSGPEVRRLSAAAQQAAAEAAGRRVAADVARTTGRVVAVTPVAGDHGLRIACDGQLSDHDSGGFFSIGDEEAACEVASLVQDVLVDRLWAAWPLCPEHEYGLRADIIDRKATWLCRRGRHHTPVGGLTG
ncbi:hypothetical protein SAMN04488107_4618 [Geodermatophilus saharensis]|uniref:Uncharacterized protein n=1 Tax=Geodermatophilus saharensis TaxID=1137994 RepID=A0A239J4M4_9ACTN|nr:hypothetical protein [Geodermatophilus saharensis]SNT00428.1 hypothetical protein SAMN04488107_4618 [Geodermatophilus saharensis]